MQLKSSAMALATALRMNVHLCVSKLLLRRKESRLRVSDDCSPGDESSQRVCRCCSPGDGDGDSSNREGDGVFVVVLWVGFGCASGGS